ncbi:DUF1638 domain-containing protein [Methanosalsum natronophilum]|uniref:DUF1638 domain-containing protein n=1 Tax=Methanosalsum natronophilum TaxID=768733 RepID=A0A3R7VSA1_9EURY|nr:DUF1638 domain-containing protein [Methanosalsum natronophilum]MCS3923068.1 hypothetical protein [Methanosalsum natronophilum]RQD82109.1 MAG: DUF1638 domain-containing protein [Methanosalsum natronophilum]
MPTISLIGCKVFEDEIIHLLENDSNIDHVLIANNKDSDSFMQKLNDINYGYMAENSDGIKKIVSKMDPNKLTIVISIMEFAYDAKPDVLKEEVYRQIEVLSDFSNGILIFYGLCGNVLGSVENDFADISCKVHILKDDQGDVVDDCICASLGGRNKYLNVLNDFKGKGIYFLTPVQATHWREMLKIAKVTPDPNDIEMTKFVFDYSGYESVGKICTGLSYEKDYDEKVQEFAELFDFQIVELDGDLNLIEKCYSRIKEDVLNNFLT